MHIIKVNDAKKNQLFRWAVRSNDYGDVIDTVDIAESILSFVSAQTSETQIPFRFNTLRNETNQRSQTERQKERKKESQKRRRGENQLIELIESSSIGDLSVRWRKTARSRQHSFHGGSNDIAGKNNHHHHQLIIQDKKIKQTKTSKTRIKSSK